MIVLHVAITNKIATYQKRDGDIVCGNKYDEEKQSGYQIKFTFDDEWNAYENKTARFIFGGQFHDVEFTGDTCPVPVLKGVTVCKVGVYAGDLCTTTSATIGCKPSILCKSATPSVENDKYYANEARKYAEEAKEYAETAELLTPFVRQESYELSGKPFFDLEIGKVYIGVADEAYRPHVHTDFDYNSSRGLKFEAVKKFTIKVIGMDGYNFIVEYCGELATFDYSIVTTAPPSLRYGRLVWAGDLYLVTSGSSEEGENGATFTPSVSEGVLSWTNDKGLDNPDPVNINGADGKTPYIKDGNWWIGETDTGVKAEGKDGVGISKIEKTATNEKIDTYTITYTNGNTFSYTVTNGTDGTNGIGISSIVKTKTNGRVDTYTITYTDKTTSTFTVTNGANGTSVTIASIGEVIDETTEEVIGHTVNFSDGKSLTVYNGVNGKDGRGISSVLKTSTNGLVDTYTITFTDNTTVTFTVTNGKAGTSVTVTNVSESTVDGGSNVVTFSDGKTLTVKNGKNGAEGKTPYIKNKTWWIGDIDTGIKAEGADGKDYVLTPADKTEIAEQAVKLIDGVPDYWLSALEEGAKEINTALCTAGRNKSAFLFYTDAHWGYGSGMSPKLLKYLGKHTGINKTIFGGDFGNTYEYPDTGKTMDDWADVMREWKLAVRDIPNHHSVVGNHDKDVTAFNSDKSLYGFLFAPEETNDIVRGGDFFYYIDDVNEKTRYFYLNTGLIHFSDEQCAFLIEGLTSVPSGWHILAVAHIWFVYDSTDTPTVGSVPTNIQKVLNLFEAYNSRSFGSVTIESKVCEYNFSDCEGWFEFCIGGHTHVDHSFTSVMGIPIILCPTDSRHTRGTDRYVAGTTSESCVSGIIADYDNRKVYIVRVGRGTSREVELTWYEVSYTNILSTALAADGVSIYNGKGWRENRKWSQSGQSESDSNGKYLTGWIKVSKGDVVYLKNIITPSDNFTLLRSNSPGSTNGSYDYSNSQNYVKAILDDAGNIIQFTWDGTGEYFRISCGGISDASIITKNEPIE